MNNQCVYDGATAFLAHERLRKFLSAVVTMAAAAFAAPGWAATWTGANGSDVADPDNWDGDVTTSAMAFTKDAYLTLGQDCSVYRVFGTSFGTDRKVTIDLSGHALTTTASENNNRDIFRAARTTICITNSGERATFTQTADMQMDDSNSTDTTLVVSGNDTVMKGTVFNRGGDRFSLRVLDGATMTGPVIAMSMNHSTNIVANGASLIGTERVNLAAGSGNKAHDNYNNGPWHGDILTVTDATLSGRELFVSHGRAQKSTGDPYGNVLIAEAGASVSFTNAYLACAANTSNNIIRVTDPDTTFTVAGEMCFGTRTSTGSISAYYATLPATNNEFILQNEANAYVKNTFIGAGGNTLRICSDAKFHGTAGGMVQLCSDMTDDFIAAAGGAVASRIEVVGGSLHFLNQISIGTQNVTNNVYGHELFVGAGGTVSEKTIHFYGVGDRLVVSNGMVETSGLYMGDYGGKHNIVRIMGEAATVRASGWDVDGTAAIFEFAIPETPWTVAPFSLLRNVTVPADFTLLLDGTALDALKARMKDRKMRNVTVPLIRAMNAHGDSRDIAVADMDGLSANLPEGCTLENVNGVISVRVAVRTGFVFTVR